ncbi:MAG: site-specific integrase, partial [Cytophagales bacterium]|nr:site-specific integrase [Cytophagales bacterium]
MSSYRDYMKLERNLSPQTVEAYLSDVKKLQSFLEEQGHGNPIEMEKQVLLDFLEKIHTDELASYSQARIISGIRSFFRYLVEEGLRKDDPSAWIEVPRLSRPLPDVLDYEEIDLLLNHIDLSTPSGHRDRAIIEVLYGSGLRVSELVNMRLEDVFADVS